MKTIFFLRITFSLLVLAISASSQKLLTDPGFSPVLDGGVDFVEILPDGKILVAGDFTTISGTFRNKIARLEPNGSVDTSFNAGSIAGPFVNISSMKLLPDGKILLAGSLPSSRKILRLNSDGSPDTTQTSFPFMGSSPTSQNIYRVDQLPSGKILICGNFSLPNGNSRPWLARYNSDGTYDPTFSTVINGLCTDLQVQADGKYLVSGDFTLVNGEDRIGLVRFNADDSIDATFAAPGTRFRKIRPQSNGTYLAFQMLSTHQVVVRLGPDGSLQTSFDTVMNSGEDIAVQSNGKVLVAGNSSVDFLPGHSVYFNRYHFDGTHDNSVALLSFHGPAGTDSPKAVAVAPDGKVIFGGEFTSFTGLPSRAYLGRFIPLPVAIKRKFDFDGDGKDDIAVFRPSDQYWYLDNSSSGFSYTRFGLSTDTPITADYDGDNRADIGVFRDGVWMWLRSGTSTFNYQVCGQAGDIPTPRYLANGRADLLVFRPSALPLFYNQQPFQNAFPVEFRGMALSPTDKPVIADYDGDGADDLAVFRDGVWSYMESTASQTRHVQFGLAGDIPAPGDFDADGRTDLAVFRPSTGIWYVKRSNEGAYAVQWGVAGDVPVVGDYDGDKRADIAVFRPSTGIWYQLRSTGGIHIQNFGLSGDIPAQAQ